MSPLLSTSEVAKQLRISRHDVARYVIDGLLAIVEFPGKKHRRFRQSDVDQFVSDHAGHKDGHIQKAEPGQKPAKQAISKRGHGRKKSGDVLWMERVN